MWQPQGWCGPAIKNATNLIFFQRKKNLKTQNIKYKIRDMRYEKWDMRHEICDMRYEI